MTLLDFPSSPTVGQQYAAPNGAIYTWDGTAWKPPQVISSGTVAGGDLAGSTYPNPTIAPGAVTDAKIASVAYTKVTGHPAAFPPNGAAGGSLAGTYPSPILAPRTVVRNFQTVNLPVNFSTATTLSWVQVVALPAQTTQGGLVEITLAAGAYILTNPTGGFVQLGWARTGSSIAAYVRYDVLGPTNGKMPVSGLKWTDTPVAGTYTYSLWVYQNSANVFFSTGPDSAATGTFSTTEFAYVS